MTSIGSITVDLAMEAQNFIASTKHAAEASEAMAHRIEAATELVKKAFEIGFGAWGAERIGEMIDQSFELGAHLIDLSAKTGASTKSIQEFQFAMKQQGASTEDADTAINKFSKSLGAAQNGQDKYGKLLMSLGVTSFTSYDQALKQVMEGLGKLPSTTQKNADATALFGKSASAVAAIASKGAEGYSELAEEAEKYGIVIDNEVLKNSKEAEDKISALKQILAADISGEIMKNADAIASFTDQLIKLVAAIPAAIEGMKNFGLEQAYSASAIESIGLGYDKNGGFKVIDNREIAKGGLMGSHGGRAYVYKDLATKYNTKVAGGEKNSDEARELLKQMAEVKHRDMEGREGEHRVPTVNDAKLKGPKAKKEPKGDNGESYLKATEGYDKQINAAKLALATNAEQRYRLEVAALDMEKGDKDKEIDANQKWDASQKTALHALNDNVASLKKEAAQRAEMDAYTQETVDIENQKRGFVEDQLKSDEALAKTQGERRKLALQILDLEYKDKFATLQAVIDKKGTTDADRDKAIREQDDLKRAKTADVKATMKGTQGPLEAYMDAIHKSADEMNESLQGIEVDGLNNLESGLMKVVEGTGSVGDAFKSMALGIIEDLAKIELEKAVLGPIANALFGATTGGGTGGLLGGLLNSVIGHRANGGMTAPGMYEVGERGPELVDIGGNASVTTARQIQGAANDNGGHHFSFAPGSIVSNDPERVRAMIMQGIATAMPLMSKQATDRTLYQAGRAKL